MPYNNENLNNRERVLRFRVWGYIFIQFVIFRIMMIKLDSESSEHDKFSTHGQLFYIGDHCCAIVFTAISVSCMIRNRNFLHYNWEVTGILGYTTLTIITTNYTMNVLNHIKLAGFNFWEDYPYGMFWYGMFILSYLIRYFQVTANLELIKVRLSLLEDRE